jgi:hypothetical protein
MSTASLPASIDAVVAFALRWIWRRSSSVKTGGA